MAKAVSHERLNRQKVGNRVHGEALSETAHDYALYKAARKAKRMQRDAVVPSDFEHCFENCWRLFRVVEESRKGMMSGRIEFSRHRETVREFDQFRNSYWLALVEWCSKNGKRLPPV